MNHGSKGGLKIKSAHYILSEEKSYEKISNILFFTALGLFFVQKTLSISMLNLTGEWWRLTELTYKACILLSFIKIALDIIKEKYDLKTLFLTTFFSVLPCIWYMKTGNSSMFILWVFILAAKGIEFDKIIQYSFYINVYLMLFVVASSLFGIVENRIYVRSNGEYRYSLGYQYTTNIANLYMHMIIMYVYWKKKKISIISIFVLMVINIAIYRLTDTRNAFGIVCLILIGAVILKYSDYFSRPHKWINYIYICSVPFFALVSVCATALYNSNITWMNFMNGLFSGRLQLGKVGLEQYGIKLFGNKIEWVGGLIDFEINKKSYNYVDSSFVQILLEFGVIALVMACIYFTGLNRKAIRHKDVWFGLAVFLIALHSILDPQLMWLEYNPFLLYGLSKGWNREKNAATAIPIEGDRKKWILNVSLIVCILTLIIFYGTELINIIRTWMNMYHFYAVERQKYFILFFILASGIILCIVKNFGERKIINRLLIGGCVFLMVVGYFSVLFMIGRKQKDYQHDIRAGVDLVKKLEKQGNQIDVVYVEDIPYCYQKELKGNSVVAGWLPKKNENAVVFAKKGNYYNTLYNNEYYGCLLYDKEYVFVKDEKLKQGMKQQGIELKKYYDGIESVDLEKLAKINNLSMVSLDSGEAAMIINGENQSLIHGPYVNIYQCKLKVIYELTLIDTNIDTGEIAKVQISSDYGGNVIVVRGINKEEFDESGKLTVSMIQDIPNSANMEFLLLANGYSKIAVTGVNYQIVE